METVLEVALINVGGSLESLEKAIDEVASFPSKGPRDDIVKDILKRLQCVERYFVIDVWKNW